MGRLDARDDEMGHNFDALIKERVDPGELTCFVDIVVTFPLICVMHSRDGLVWPVSWTMG